MLIPKKNRIAILTKLFEDGCLCAKKDIFAEKHHEIETVPNLHVMKLLQSLKSNGYVKEQFAWQWLYWTLTDEGITYLREYLHLPEDIKPATLNPPQVQQPAMPQFRGGGGRGGDRPQRFDRDGGYRERGERGFKKEIGAPKDFRPSFDGAKQYRGAGRGAPMQRPEQR